MIQYIKDQNHYVETTTGEILKFGYDHEFNKKALLLPDTELWFGKYRGKTLQQISRDDPKYIYWLYDAGFNLANETRKLSNERTKERMKESGLEVDVDVTFLSAPKGLMDEKQSDMLVNAQLRDLGRRIDNHMFEKHGDLTDPEGGMLLPTGDEEFPWY